MNLFFIQNKIKNRAQAMVEFAVILPVLLLLIIGTMEVGRLIFIFSSVANASRQAARYGSASGEVTSDVTHYQDCEGIRKIANRSAYLIKFDKVNITYDRGLNPDGSQIPISGINPSPATDSCPVEPEVIRNGDRIIVQVSAEYKPILSFIPIQPIEIVSASARSFLISVPILGSSMPTAFAAESSTPSRVPVLATSTIRATSTIGNTSTAKPYHTPANTLTPTITFTPSQTPLPTITPSITPTSINCTGLTGVSHGPLVFHDNVMEMTINNNSGYVLSTSQIYLEWNHDRGHSNDSDTGLRLTQILFEYQVWNGNIQSPSAYIYQYYPKIPNGESKIQFVFHQTYNALDGTERIIINIGTPGCTNYPIDSRN